MEFRKIHLPAGKEKARIHAGLQDFGSYEKEEKVSTVKSNSGGKEKRKKNKQQSACLLD